MPAVAAWPSVLSITVVCLVTLGVSALGLKLSHTTSDFFVAGRGVSAPWNAAAIGGEYLSAASFLGVAGLLYLYGPDMLWFPVGFTTGFLVLLVLVAAPLRRSGAYTLPDFAEARLESRQVRRICSVFVVIIGSLYMLPQLEAGGLIFQVVVGAPKWIGEIIVAVVVLASVLAGGMRSITFVQGVQYWIKLTAMAVPAIVLFIVWQSHGQPSPASGPGHTTEWQIFLGGFGGREHPAYQTYSTLIALCLGTMGLPHILVRYYTNRDGRAARRTTVFVIALVGLFYVLTPSFAVLGRAYLPVLPPGAPPETVPILLPLTMAPGPLGTTLTAIVAAGAFVACLSTASGLAIAVGGVVAQDLLEARLRRLGRFAGVHDFRIALVVAIAIPYAVSLVVTTARVTDAVAIAFAVSSSTFCPLLVLGVWWRRLSIAGAFWGTLVGGVLSLGAALAALSGLTAHLSSWPRALIEQPAAWTVPIAFAVTIFVSLATPRKVPEHVDQTMFRLHAPEALRRT